MKIRSISEQILYYFFFVTRNMRCHYEVLQIEQSADASEIKVAYRKQALVWHPDKNMDVRSFLSLFYHDH